jgi:hypothetical protein
VAASPQTMTGSADGSPQNWACDEDCARRSRSLTMLASSCAVRGKIRQPAAGVAVKMSYRVRKRVGFGRGSRQGGAA